MYKGMVFAEFKDTYCWWTKSCTTKDDDYPIIYRVLTIPGGAGFRPPTVWKRHGRDFVEDRWFEERWQASLGIPGPWSSRPSRAKLLLWFEAAVQRALGGTIQCQHFRSCTIHFDRGWEIGVDSPRVQTCNWLWMAWGLVDLRVSKIWCKSLRNWLCVHRKAPKAMWRERLRGRTAHRGSGTWVGAMALFHRQLMLSIFHIAFTDPAIAVVNQQL